MTNLPNPPTHPEIAPRQSVGPVGTTSVGGEIIFNRSTPPLQDPEGIIKEAIRGGDTVETRIRQFQEAMTPEQK